MKKIIARAFALGALAASLGALPAQATPLTWNLDGVKFSDGTSASGSFTVDWDAKTWSAFDIQTQDGRLAAFDYAPNTSGLYFSGFGSNSISLIANGTNRYMTLDFATGLSTAGTVAINTGKSWDCDNCGNYRMVTAGSVSSQSVGAEVPEPASLALVLPALGLVALARRRKQK